MNSDQRDLACDRAYREHAPDVYRVAYGILRNSEEALDATHDAFARAWERWDQYDSQRPLKPWLFGIVVHVALDQLRRRRVRGLFGLAGGRATAVAVDPATDVVERRVVEQAMADFPPETRAALVLRHYYGYEYAQIGELLGKPAGTVGSLLSRAHAALRERLGEGSDSPLAAERAGEPHNNPTPDPAAHVRRR